MVNCAVMIGDGRVLGMVPKSFLPNYSEYYEQRWFVSGTGMNETEVDPDLGTFHVRVDQLFELGDCCVGAEICEDLWAPISPGTHAALAGANIVCNLSASNELISKADYRRDLVRMTSASNFSGYVYASASALESTKDVVFGGHCLIAEAGQILAENHRFDFAAQTLVADIDLQRLSHDRAQNSICNKHSGRVLSQSESRQGNASVGGITAPATSNNPLYRQMTKRVCRQSTGNFAHSVHRASQTHARGTNRALGDWAVLGSGFHPRLSGGERCSG